MTFHGTHRGAGTSIEDSDAVQHDVGRLRAAGTGPAEIGWVMPEPADAGGRPWLRWVGPLVSLAIVAAAINHFRGSDWHRVAALVPRSPLFWLVFVANYFAQPIMDFVIFRRLWGIPPAGFAALVRKYISNEVLLGYSGELYFYTWARRRATLDGAGGCGGGGPAARSPPGHRSARSRTSPSCRRWSATPSRW